MILILWVRVCDVEDCDRDDEEAGDDEETVTVVELDLLVTVVEDENDDEDVDVDESVEAIVGFTVAVIVLASLGCAPGIPLQTL